MKDSEGKVIYVGKAKNLRQRVRQYFSKGGDGRYMIPFLIEKVVDIDTLLVKSEKEALLLENNLIKKHKPKYNALLKDDKSYIAIKLTKHTWPRIDIVRYRGKPKSPGRYFGPYTRTGSARKTFDLLHQLFPIRQCSDQEFMRRTRPCLLYDMKKCIAPCVGKCSREEYDHLVKQCVKFLRGDHQEFLRDLYREMNAHSDNLEFEKANEVLRKIRDIEATFEKQNVDQPSGPHADAIGIYREGEEVSLVVMMFHHGRLIGSQRFNFSKIAQDDAALLETFLIQLYEEKPDLPHEILTPIALSNSETLSELFSQEQPRKVLLINPKKGKKYSLVQMAHLNAKEAFQRDKDTEAVRQKMLLSMQEKFHFMRFPGEIECFDTSHIAGTDFVATKVSFKDGLKNPSKYRKYKVRQVNLADDYGAMHEVLTRRFRRAKEEADLPDLLIVDGGKGHLNIALKVLEELNIISVDVIGVAKEEGRHDKGMTAEQVFLPKSKDPIILPKTSPILFLLQSIRDEAHRTAISYHRKKRGKSLIKSALDDIPGIGPEKKKKLIRHLGSLKKIKEASEEELQKTKGISKRDACAIHNSLKS